MYISELIELLNKIQDEKGDLRVRANNECGTATTVSESDVYWHTLTTGETVVEFDV